MADGVTTVRNVVPLAFRFSGLRKPSNPDGIGSVFGLIATHLPAHPSFICFLLLNDLAVDVFDEIQRLAASGLEVTTATHAILAAKKWGKGDKPSAARRKNKAIEALCWVFQTTYEFNTPYIQMSSVYRNIWFHVKNGVIQVGPAMTPKQGPAVYGEDDGPAPISLLEALIDFSWVSASAKIQNHGNHGCILRGTCPAAASTEADTTGHKDEQIDVQTPGADAAPSRSSPGDNAPSSSGSAPRAARVSISSPRAVPPDLAKSARRKRSAKRLADSDGPAKRLRSRQ